MSQMIDTMVLSFGLRRPSMSRDEKEQEFICDSRALIQSMPTIIVSAITYAELAFFANATESAALTAIAPKIEQIPFDAAAAEEAASLYRASRKAFPTCHRCLNPVHKPEKCDVCGVARAKQTKLNDFYIAGSALAHQVDTLFTYDGAIAKFAPKARLTVEPPPSAGGQLFGLPRRTQG